jgi:hypothetical protein
MSLHKAAGIKTQRKGFLQFIVFHTDFHQIFGASMHTTCFVSSAAVFAYVMEVITMHIHLKFSIYKIKKQSCLTVLRAKVVLRNCRNLTPKQFAKFLTICNCSD